MKRCEEFEIEIEMRHHGALDEPARAALDTHVASCASCRSFADASAASERLMKEKATMDMAMVDWEALRTNVRTRIRGDELRRWKAGGLVLAAQAVAMWTFNAGHRRQAFTSLAITVALVAAGLLVVSHLRARRMRGYESSRDDLLFFHRHYLETRLGWSTLGLVVLPVLALGYLGVRLRGPARGTEEWLGALLMTATLLGAWGYLAFVRRPRLKREIDALKKRD